MSKKQFTISRLICLLVLFVCLHVNGQTRFYDPSFGVGVSYNIEYGVSYGLLNGPETLLLDVYQPLNDTMAKRPVIVMAHGGGYVMGNKNNLPMETICSRFAQMGYVCVSIDYSLGYPKKGTENHKAKQTVLMSIQDMKASVRYLRSTIDSGNPYKIDPDNIWIGGSSAGAITAIHYAFFDDDDFYASKFDLNKLGGLEGVGGHHNYPSNIQGVISLSGAIGDTNAIQANEKTPLAGLHGDADGIVPYGSSKIHFKFPFIDDVPEADVMGDSVIEIRMKNIDGEYDFIALSGQKHCPFDKVLNWKHYELYMDTTINFMRNFMYNQMWNDGPPVNDYSTNHTSEIYYELVDGEFQFYPVDKYISRIQVTLTDVATGKKQNTTIKKDLKAFKWRPKYIGRESELIVEFGDHRKTWTFLAD